MNKRVPYPQNGPPTQPAVPLTLPGALPPKTSLPTQPTADVKAKTAEDRSPSYALPGDLKEATFGCLKDVMSKCLGRAEKRVTDDVKKRVDALRTMWDQGKLSDAVQKKTFQLVSELHKGNFDQANTLHVSLMVDYASEVTPWMVGIKRLISASQDEQSAVMQDS